MGGGANSFGCGGRSTVSAFPRIVEAPSAASAETAASSSAPSGGRTTVVSGSTPRISCTISRPAACWVARSAERPLASNEGIVGAEKGIAVTWTRWGGHRLSELGEQRGGVRGAVGAALDLAAVDAPVSVRHPGELIEQRRLDDQVDGAELLPARQPAERGHLRAEGSGRSHGRLELAIDQEPVRIERGGRRQLDRRREEERDLGLPDQEDHRRVQHGDLGPAAPKIDPHRVDERVGPADAADGRQVHGRAEPARSAGLQRVLLGGRDGEDRQLGSRGERRLVRRARPDRRADRDAEREIVDRLLLRSCRRGPRCRARGPSTCSRASATRA